MLPLEEPPMRIAKQDVPVITQKQDVPVNIQRRAGFDIPEPLFYYYSTERTG